MKKFNTEADRIHYDGRMAGRREVRKDTNAVLEYAWITLKHYDTCKQRCWRCDQPPMDMVSYENILNDSTEAQRVKRRMEKK